MIDTVLKNFYVDDCLKSVQSNEVAGKLRADLCVLLSRGGFRLTEWLCNKRKVLKTIPTTDRTSSILDLDLNSCVLPIEITLDVGCNMDTDMFTYKMVPKDKSFTRGGILSLTSFIHYLLDIASLITLLAKKLLQDLCKQGLTSDEEIVGEKFQSWRRWLSNLPMLSSVALPTCLKRSTLAGYKMQSFTTLQMPLRFLMGLCHMQNSSVKMVVPTAVSSLGNLA